MSALSDMIAKQKAGGDSEDATKKQNKPMVFRSKNSKNVADDGKIRETSAAGNDKRKEPAKSTSNAGIAFPQSSKLRKIGDTKRFSTGSNNNRTSEKRSTDSDNKRNLGIDGKSSARSTLEKLENRPASPAKLDPEESLPSAPPRELPDNISEQQQKFVDALDGIHKAFQDPEILSNMLRTVMVELQETPELMELVEKEDLQMMVRGMRETLGYIRQTKAKKKRKAGGAKKGKKNALTTDEIDELDALLGEKSLS